MFYQDFPGISQYCTHIPKNQFAFDYELFSTACNMYIGISVAGLHHGFNLTLSHYPQLFLTSGEAYIIKSIDPSYGISGYYRTFYYNVVENNGPGVLIFAHTKLSSSDAGELYISSNTLCNKYYDYPSSSLYCYSTIGKNNKL